LPDISSPAIPDENNNGDENDNDENIGGENNENSENNQIPEEKNDVTISISSEIDYVEILELDYDNYGDKINIESSGQTENVVVTAYDMSDNELDFISVGSDNYITVKATPFITNGMKFYFMGTLTIGDEIYCSNKLEYHFLYNKPASIIFSDSKDEFFDVDIRKNNFVTPECKAVVLNQDGELYSDDAQIKYEITNPSKNNNFSFYYFNNSIHVD
jgi:hypothetical protein